MTRVSVVMGVYNAGELLDETLASILNQTHDDFEVILVDDGSRVPVVATDPRVRVIRHDKNQGLTRALITGCAAATGEYIARHDVADLSHPTRLAKQAALLDANRDVAFVSCHTQFIGPEREPLWIHRAKSIAPTQILDITRKHGVIDGPSSHGSVVFRRDAYHRAGGYRPAFYYGQDWDLWYRLASVGHFQTVDEVLYEMRVMPDGISATARDAQFAIAELSEAAMRARAAGQSDDEILKRAAAITKRQRPFAAHAKGLYFIGEALRRNRDPRARRYFLRAIASAPILPRPWLRLVQSILIR